MDCSSLSVSLCKEVVGGHPSPSYNLKHMVSSYYFNCFQWLQISLDLWVQSGEGMATLKTTGLGDKLGLLRLDATFKKKLQMIVSLGIIIGGLWIIKTCYILISRREIWTLKLPCSFLFSTHVEYISGNDLFIQRSKDVWWVGSEGAADLVSEEDNKQVMPKTAVWWRRRTLPADRGFSSKRTQV